MEKLDKVIAGLSNCCVDDCGNCEYCGNGCSDRLMKEARDLLKELSSDNQRLREMWADAVKKQSILRSELAEERERSARWVRESEPVVHAHWVPVECGTLCSNCTRVFDSDFEIRHSVCRELKRCPACGAHMGEGVADGIG